MYRLRRGAERNPSLAGQDINYPGSASDNPFPMSSSPESSPFSEPFGGVNWIVRAALDPVFGAQSMRVLCRQGSARCLTPKRHRSRH
jgi:hypothetical protein